MYFAKNFCFMKYFLTLCFLVFLVACNAPKKETFRLVNYVNNIALNTPGWDNNEYTQHDMEMKLSKSFNKDLQDSNLLQGFPVKLISMKKIASDGFEVTLGSSELAKNNRYGNGDETTVSFTVISILPASIATTIKEDDFYIITDYAKIPGDTSYVPAGFNPLANTSHTIMSCYLGKHTIRISKIEPYVIK